MAKNANPKYKLIRTKKMPINNNDWKPQRFYQLVALRDIPLHDVKVGDLGGFVGDKYILSHDGDCWIGENAQVIDNVRIIGDAYVGGNALLVNFLGWPFIVKDRARITGDVEAWLHVEARSNNPRPHDLKMVISGNADISGKSWLENVREVSGNAKIHGEVVLEDVSVVSGSVEICGKVKIREGVILLGNTKISGETTVGNGVSIRDCIISDVEIPNYSEINGQIITADGLSMRPKKEVTVAYKSHNTSAVQEIEALDSTAHDPGMPPKAKRIMAVYQETLAGIASYETDIVKIIKYPVMTDRTDPLTRAMVSALKDAQHFADNPEDPDFMEAVRTLEDAYLAAESHALKLAGTVLSDDERKKMERAKDLLAIASNEGSSENEKKVSFKQAFKQLEGVVVVPEIAIDTFRVKIGLAELEM
jgi:carbonic anhydrase/acetyltransferase-like protein (isoleucine patch superfamily)